MGAARLECGLRTPEQGILLLHIFVYDPYCGPRTRFRSIVGFLNTKRGFNSVGFVQADQEGLLGSIPAGRRHRSFRLVAPDGTVTSGATALPLLIGLMPAGRTLGGIVKLSPPVSFATKILYSTFSRLHDSGTCAHAPGSASTSISTSMGIEMRSFTRRFPGC